REIVFGHDGSFSFDALVQRYNADLANGYGNLVSRTLTMIGKYFDGVIPTPVDEQHRGNPRPIFDSKVAQYEALFDSLNFSKALEVLWSEIASIDADITGLAPWKIAAEGTDSSRLRLSGLLYEWAEAIRIITALVYPVIPDAAAKVWAQLGLGDIHTADLKNLTWGGLKPGTKLAELGPVFPRAEKDAITRMQEIEQSNNADSTPGSANRAAEPAAVAATPVETQGLAVAAAEEAAPPSIAAPTQVAPPLAREVGAKGGTEQSSEKITIDDFAKVELRVAQIKVAERVPKADKLLRLEVDLGYEQRQILAGIAEAYAPESLIGRKVVIVANLAPRKLRGLESNGMIVAASLEGGKPVLAGFLEDVEIGARLK
ncbi:MAG TPA: methionine--tRNA ligase subunit beta, partial [Silvibacterium sp.]|nr:methionine--tRNA ligase subunit beta [Silvibacterium sp.]